MKNNLKKWCEIKIKFVDLSKLKNENENYGIRSKINRDDSGRIESLLH
jgi:hypothetical protein